LSADSAARFAASRVVLAAAPTPNVRPSTRKTPSLVLACAHPFAHTVSGRTFGAGAAARTTSERIVAAESEEV